MALKPSRRFARMNKLGGWLTVVCIAVIVVLLCTAALGQHGGGKQVYVPNEYIVKAQAGSDPKLVAQAVERMGATLVQALPVTDHYLIRLGRWGGHANLYNTRSATQPFRWVIEAIQPNYLYYLCAVPNDEHWNKLWNMRQINMPTAWEIEKGKPRVTVAVIDSGVANHPDLQGRLVPGYDFIDNDTDASNDVIGHGTHCAGIIAAQGNNAIGVCGVCWNGVRVMPIRVFGTGATPTSLLIQGEDYALKNGAHVASMSYGGYGDDPAHRAKISEMATAGMILVAAAGNDSTDLPSYPACYPEVISVSSVGPYDAIAGYSNYGKIDIAAPGGDSSLGQEAAVYSTLVTWSNNAPTYTYGYMEGTSMACPHVSGAAALLLSYGVPASEVKNRLLTSARPPRSGGMDPSRYGAGILDVRAALANAILRIVEPAKGATVGTTPDFRIAIQGINLATVRIYIDYADANDDGVPDDPNEGLVIDGTTVYFYLNSSRTAIQFNWRDISPSNPMTTGAHNLYVSADAAAGGGSVSDWCVFTVAKRKIESGIHMVAFPYDLTQRGTDTPDKILPGTSFLSNTSSRSVLIRWIPIPRSTTDTNPIGYDVYDPLNPVDRVWLNPTITTLGTSLVTGGGYVYDSALRQLRYVYPAGAGFWLIVPYDVWINESYATLDSLSSFDGSKGFQIPIYKGWNMIGNPYAHSIPWRAALFTYQGKTKTLIEAEKAGWVRSVLYTYGGSNVGYQRVTDRDLLEPFTGYWLYATVGGTTTDSLILTLLP
jgi:hypothetical protein